MHVCVTVSRTCNSAVCIITRNLSASAEACGEHRTRPSKVGLPAIHRAGAKLQLPSRKANDSPVLRYEFEFEFALTLGSISAAISSFAGVKMLHNCVVSGGVPSGLHKRLRLDDSPVVKGT